ncbi:DUF680 domain-containing protein [Mesorhizobium sp. M0166]|uniref:DUF680 domain-containing protein n=1 Tax=unclassified Mesorhizobium TaxID=325217 RepID=UPI003337603D
MNRITFAALSMLLVTGTAFAGSDHYGSNSANQPAATVDHSYTASIQASDIGRQNGVDTKVTTGPSQMTVQDVIAQHNRDGIWGR